MLGPRAPNGGIVACAPRNTAPSSGYTSPMVWKRWGAALDRLPARAGLPLGLGLGALIGALLLLTPAAVWVPAFLLLCGAAGFLAWSGEPVEALPAPAPRVEAVPTVPVATEAHAGFELVAIPAGRFLMGSPKEEEGRYDDEGPAHEVGISDFLCMKTPVTRRFYAAVVGAAPGWPEGETRPGGQGMRSAGKAL